MPSSFPFSTACWNSSNQFSERYSVISPGRGCIKTWDEPAFLKLIRSLSISSLVISAFQTKKGAVEYSRGGSLNCDERVAKSGTLTSFITVFLQEFKIIKKAKSIKMAECLATGVDFIVVRFSNMKTNLIIRRIQISR